MEFTPININDVYEHSYLLVPQELFVNPLYKQLDAKSKLLYALLLNRLQLSLVNKDRFTDSDGNVFLYFSREEAGDKLNLSKNTITSAFEEIKKAKLIYEKRIGFNPAMRIYIGKMNHVTPRKITGHKKWDYKEQKNGNAKSQNLRGNNNEYSNNRNSNIGDNKTSYFNYEQRSYDSFDNLYANSRFNISDDTNKDEKGGNFNEQ